MVSPPGTSAARFLRARTRICVVGFSIVLLFFLRILLVPLLLPHDWIDEISDEEVYIEITSRLASGDLSALDSRELNLLVRRPALFLPSAGLALVLSDSQTALRVLSSFSLLVAQLLMLSLVSRLGNESGQKTDLSTWNFALMLIFVFWPSLNFWGSVGHREAPFVALVMTAIYLLLRCKCLPAGSTFLGLVGTAAAALLLIPELGIALLIMILACVVRGNLRAIRSGVLLGVGAVLLPLSLSVAGGSLVALAGISKSTIAGVGVQAMIERVPPSNWTQQKQSTAIGITKVEQTEYLSVLRPWGPNDPTVTRTDVFWFLGWENLLWLALVGIALSRVLVRSIWKTPLGLGATIFVLLSLGAITFGVGNVAIAYRFKVVVVPAAVVLLALDRNDTKDGAPRSRPQPS